MRHNAYSKVIGLLADLTGPTQKGFKCRLFDSGGGSTTSTTQNFSPEESAKRVQVMDEATRIYGENAGTITNSAYPGATPVPFSPETQAAQNYAVNYALGPGLQQANNINNAVQFGLKDVLFPSTNPALQSTIDAAVRPIYQDYTDPGGVMSQIRTQAGEAGQFGSSRQGIAEGIAAGRYANAASDAAAKVATEGYNKGLDTFSRTLAFAPQSIQAGMLPADVLGAVGLQNEMYQSELANYEAAARMWGLNAPWAPLQNYASIVFGGANPSTTSSMNQSTSPLQVLGALGSLGSMFFSDRRLKEEIKLVGKDKRTGLNLYEFKYKFWPDKFIGVMADEVQKVMPEAVAKLGKYLGVDYDKLGVSFVKVN